MPVKSIPLPTLKFGKRKERSQMCEALTVDGRWVDKEMPALNNCVDDGHRAFLLDADNQYYCPEDGQWHQVLSELDAVPLQLRTTSYLIDGEDDDEDIKKISNDLFMITSEQAQAEQYRIAKQSDSWDKLMWIFTIVFGSFVVICGMVFIWG
jgi:hypothetical protein